MRWKKFMNEIFNTNVDIKNINNGIGLQIYEFIINDQKYIFEASLVDLEVGSLIKWKIWDIDFKNESFESNTNNPGEKFKITNTGNAPLVFSAILKCIKKLFQPELIKEINKRYKFAGIRFSADKNEPSRVKLYDTMSRRFNIPNFKLIREAEKYLVSYKFLSNEYIKENL